MATSKERETIINFNVFEAKEQGTISFYSSHTPHINRIKRQFAHAIKDTLIDEPDSFHCLLDASVWRHNFKLLPVRGRGGKGRSSFTTETPVK